MEGKEAVDINSIVITEILLFEFEKFLYLFLVFFNLYFDLFSRIQLKKKKFNRFPPIGLSHSIGFQYSFCTGSAF